MPAATFGAESPAASASAPRPVTSPDVNPPNASASEAAFVAETRVAALSADTWLAAVARHEVWLLLPAGLPLVFRERFPLWLQLAALVWIAVLWVVRRAATGRWTIRTAIDPPVLALLLTIPGAVMVIRPEVADIGVGVSRAESLIFAVALCYAVANTVYTPARAWSAGAWLLAAGLGLSAVGLVSADWSAKYAALAPVLARLPRVIGSVPHATFDQAVVHPNSLASLLVLLIPLAVAVVVWPVESSRRDEREPLPDALRRQSTTAEWTDPVPRTIGMTVQPRYLRPLAVVSLVVMAGVLLLTQSRGAWLALVVALAAMAALRRTWLAGLVAIGSIAAVVVGWSITYGTQSRLELWRATTAMLRDSPLAGIGLNTFPLVYGQDPAYSGYYVYQGYAHAHNLVLQAGLDYGVPGLVAVAGLHAALAWAAWRLLRRTVGTPLDALVVGLAFGLAAHALHGLIDALAIGGKPGFVPWAAAGALVGLRRYAYRWLPRLPGAR
ncbi:MAG: O-antigen ligase family protein [Anaerolineae bacterium]